MNPFRLSLLPMLTTLFFHPYLAQGEIGFVERFALAKDRSAALKELIPGTEDYYFYTALHAQNEGRLAEAASLLDPWRERFGETERYLSLRNRQQLLNFRQAPQDTFAFLERELGLSFHHQRDKLDAKPDFPVKLDPSTISRDAFLTKILATGQLSGVRDEGLDALIRRDADLKPAQQRELLSRLRYPDHESLVERIAADLRRPESQGFGEFEIHRRLTLTQLDQLAGLQPTLAHDPRFVDQRLLRLRPSEDVFLLRNPEAERAWLDRTWDYVRTLPPAFGSLKAAVLYRRLDLARRRGDYPQEDFLEYLRLPRALPYMRRDYLRDQQAKGVALVDLNADFHASLGLRPIGGDEALVRDYLEHFFIEAESTAPYSTYLDENWLNVVFAETKLLHGIGDAQRWFSLLGPARVQELQNRVEITFAPTNPALLKTEDDVVLHATLKNVPELIVKVYEINTLNYYRDRGEEIDTDLDLDGLVANEEKVIRYNEAPVRRHREEFPFESLKGKRGVWVVELIGNGISSRALIRKGGLQALTQTTVGGELLTVVDEANQPVPEASAWFGGRRYDADEKGFILLPFSEAGTVPVVLSAGDFASLEQIPLPREQYDLDAGFLLEHESLLPGAEATLLVRPRLSLQGESVSLSRLKKVKLTVATRDVDGVESLSEAEDFALFDDRASTHRFRVPSRLQAIKVSLSAEIESLTKAGEQIPLSGEHRFEVNGIENREIVADAYLSRLDDRYLVEVLGRSGEAMPDQAVTLTFHHRHFHDSLEITLKSDARGRIDLGPLPGIASIGARGTGLLQRQWVLDRSRVSRPAVIHAKAGEAIEIPLPLDAAGGRESLAIFETRAGALVADAFSAVHFDAGCVRLEGLPSGNYEIFLKDEHQRLTLKVTAAEREHFNHALSRDRHLRLAPDALYIASVESAEGKLRIRLGNPDETTRLHLVATRFLPSFPPHEGLGLPAIRPMGEIRRGASISRYVSGRDIGEEYRYILERRNARKFPGNLLARPGLLLNPWELSETQTAVQEAREGEALRKSAPAPMAAPMEVLAEKATSPVAMAVDQNTTPSFRFLAHPAVVLANLPVGEDGTVTLELSELGDRQHLHLVAVNDSDTVSHALALPEPEGGAAIRDLRLDETLDLTKHHSQRRRVTLLRPGQTLTVPDIHASEVQPYGTLGDVYKTLLAISEDEGLAEFGFVAKWAGLEEAEKRRLYSEHACHELNFFLSRKDPDFFETVVRPYLSNKKEKTFLDHYLLEEPLEPYLAPWEYSRLNIVERILLGRRLGGDEPARTAAHVSGLLQLLPPNPEEEAYLYRRALRGRQADADAAGVPVDVAYAHDLDDGGRAKDKRRPSVPTLRLRQMAGGNADLADAPPTSSVSRSAREPEESLLGRAREHLLYQSLDKTKELAENNYRHLPIADHNADLVRVNPFWLDFANWNGTDGFYSRSFPAANANFTEMMFALSVLDLPLSEAEHRSELKDKTYKITAASPLVIFHEEIVETTLAEDSTPILVSQNFLRIDDRQREENGQMVDKFITGEFLVGKIYASQAVVTNPTSSPHRLDLLVQIPEGAVPVAGSDYLQSHPLNLAPYSTHRIETKFYFPAPSGEGRFALYPLQVAKGEQVIAAAEPREFKVVDSPSEIDESSWEYLSQHGTEAQVLDYLSANNLHRLDLSRIAWRARESVDFLRRATERIAAHHGFDPVLWSYGIHHQDPVITREYLKHREDFLRRCGQWLDCELVRLDPVERHWQQHLDYAPLVNARTHRLGREHRILNDRFRNQYGEFLNRLAHKPRLETEDRLGVAVYLSLQDRIEEALDWIDSIPEKEVVSRLQYDYLRAYHAFHREDPAAAKAIADRYADHPVDKWRQAFAAVAAQVAEITGSEAGNPPGEETRESRLESLSSREPFLELRATGRDLVLKHRQLRTVTVNYYEMDLEFLFSRRPFVSAENGGFAYIRPNLVETRELPEDGSELRFTVPEAFASKNVLIEVNGGGRTSTAAVYSNRLDLRLIEGYGRLELRQEDNGKPLPRSYVKVFAKMKDGATRFFKDGYTDLRGQFDYASLSTDELDQVDRFSLLVMSEDFGSLVREVKPPQR